MGLFGQKKQKESDADVPQIDTINDPGKVSPAKQKTATKSVGDRKFARSQDWIGIKDIEDRYATYMDGRAVGIVEVDPYSLDLLSEEAKYQQIVNLSKVYDTMQFKFHVVSQQRQVDLTHFIDQYRDLLAAERNQIKKELLRAEIDELVQIMGTSNAVETALYILVISRSDADGISTLLSDLSTVAYGFEQIGMVARVLPAVEIRDFYRQLYRQETCDYESLPFLL